MVSTRLGLLSHRQDVGTTRWPTGGCDIAMDLIEISSSLFMDPAGAPASAPAPDQIQVKDDEPVSKGRSRFVIIS